MLKEVLPKLLRLLCSVLAFASCQLIARALRKCVIRADVGLCWKANELPVYKYAKVWKGKVFLQMRKSSSFLLEGTFLSNSDFSCWWLETRQCKKLSEPRMSQEQIYQEWKVFVLFNYQFMNLLSQSSYRYFSSDYCKV